MISTAVIVGEMAATDWANKAGMPNTFVFSPVSLMVDGGSGVASGVSVMLLVLLCVAPHGYDGVVSTALRRPGREVTRSADTYSGKD
jgi:hypothetical protein